MGTKPEERMSVLEERADWHRNIGWGLAGVFGTIVGVLLTWYIPKELATLREAVQSDTRIQLEPINEKLARIGAIVELRETKDVGGVLRRNLNEFSGQNPTLAAKAVAVIAEQARAEQIKTDPQVLIEANTRLRELSDKQPSLVTVTWAARLELIGYRTFLNSGTKSARPSPVPVFQFPGTTLTNIGISSGQQALDGVYWRNAVFENTEITYNGGPMALENVLFINCTFKMKPGLQTDKFANTVLAKNLITGIFQ